MGRAGAVIAGLCVAASSAPALAGQAYLTRIEPRPYYGATVTLEAGVRVFRALPPTKHMIINPGHATALNLSHTEVNERRTSHNYHYYRGTPARGHHVSGGLPIVTYGKPRKADRPGRSAVSGIPAGRSPYAPH